MMIMVIMMIMMTTSCFFYPPKLHYYYYGLVREKKIVKFQKFSGHHFIITYIYIVNMFIDCDNKNFHHHHWKLL